MIKKKTYPAKYPVKVGFSRSVVAGNYVFVSGCSGQTLETFHVSSNDVIDQTSVALEKIRGALEEAGALVDDIVKTVLYLTCAEDYPQVRNKILQYYREYGPRLINEPPAETVICVPALHEPDMLVEIDAIALIKSKEIIW